MGILATKIISSLNNYNSITPIVTKDLVENCGRTAMAYCNGGEKTKKYEATEKFVEANMSSVLWYGAIPFTKKMFDLTLFKACKLNPDVSLQYLKKGVQNISSVKEKISGGELPQYISKGKKKISTIKVLDSIQKNSKKFKGLHITRLALSTIIPTALSAIVLPKAIIALTQKKVVHDKQNKTVIVSSTPSFKSFETFDNFLKFGKKSVKKVAFNSLSKTLIEKATQAQTSLLGDMVSVDLAISGSRIYYANKREKEALNGRKTNAPYAAALEKIITEGGFLYLIYFGGKHIKNAIDKFTKNKFDPLLLEDKNFVTELKSGAFAQNPLKSLNEKDALSYIDKNINNEKSVFIKYAKKMKLVDTVKDETGKICRNPLKYLDVKGLSEQFDVWSSEALTFMKNNGSDLQKYIAKKVRVKRLGIIGNLAVSSFVVSYVLPKFTYIFRKWYTGNSEEPGIIKVVDNK